MYFKMKQFYKKFTNKMGLIYLSILSGLWGLPMKIFADSTSNPWGGDSSGVDPGNLQSTISGDTTGTLKSVSIVVGTFLMLGGVTVLYKVLNRDADERKEHGNSVITLLIAGLCSVVGIVLLGIAWKGLSYTG